MTLQVQQELAQAESAPSSPTRMGSVVPAGAGAVEPIVAARVGAALGYTVRNLLADLGMEVGLTCMAATAMC